MSESALIFQLNDHLKKMRISSLVCVLLLIVSIELSGCKNHRIQDRITQRPSSTPVKGEKERGVRFGTITRDEWLAKEYFGYLCAPTECLSDESKLELTETCFDPHEKLKSLVTSCFGSTRKCSSATNEEKVMNCIIVASTQDPQLIPLLLHDCVDQRITMKDWKCIRRHFMEKLKTTLTVGNPFRGRKGLKEEPIVSANVTIFDM